MVEYGDMMNISGSQGSQASIEISFQILAFSYAQAIHSAVPQPGRLLQQPHIIASTEVTSLGCSQTHL